MAASKRSTGRKRSSSTANKRGSGRRYGMKANWKVNRAIHERKHGSLPSGSGKKVTSRKQAIAIGLSEARRSGATVPSASTK